MTFDLERFCNWHWKSGLLLAALGLMAVLLVTLVIILQAQVRAGQARRQLEAAELSAAARCFELGCHASATHGASCGNCSSLVKVNVKGVK